LTGSPTLNYDGHPGWDYAVVIGTPVYAVADGQVVVVTTETGSGKYIRLQHGTEYQSQYLHLDEQLVALNATVIKGQLIGKSGNSGNVAPHLHFEVKKLISGSWVSIDPYGWTGAGADPYQIANTRLWEDAPTVNYVITVNAAPSAGGSVSGNGTFASGSSRTVTASANSGYTFSKWTESGNQVSTSASYTFTLSGNRSLVAVFSAATASAFAGAFDGGNGRKWIAWFGWYNDQNWPWIWDYQYNDWLWVMDSGPQNVWFFTNAGQEWFWTRTDWAPWVLFPNGNRWVWRSN
jgi:hypothetical protein